MLPATIVKPTRPVVLFAHWLPLDSHTMHQRRQTEDASGSGEMPQRPLMTPFTSHLGAPYQPHQPQQLHTNNYLQYSIPMDPSLRSYSHQQQPMQQLLLPPQGMYWQAAPMGLDTLGFNTKQGRHGNSLDLEELGGMLDADAASNATAGRPSLDGPSEMTMNGFDVISFHKGMTSSTQAAVVTSDAFPPPIPMATVPPKPVATPTEPTAPRVTTSRKTKKANLPPSDATTKALVDAAYTHFTESSTESDFRPGKLFKDKSEKCQFHDCPNQARVSQSYGKFCNRHVIVAPCGFPGCRDKAMDRGAMCATHTEQGKEALQKILDARSQNVPVCKISGCYKNDQGRGYCRGHEKLLMATGRLPPHINKRRLNSAYTMCSYPDCTKHSQRHHLCRTHGNLLIKQARDMADRPGATDTFEDILSRMQKEIRRCTHENCSKNSQRDRLCTMHYSEKHHLQKGDTAAGTSAPAAKEKKNAKKPRGGGNSRAAERISCEHSGCEKLSYTAGLCAEHVKENRNSALSQARFGHSFSSDKSNGTFPSDVDTVSKPESSDKPQASGPTFSAGLPSMTNSHTKCTNPMCDRESYGRDYCEACQRLFSSLAAPINLTSSAGYVQNATSGSADLPDSKSLLCRVSDCGQGSVRGGLCSAHLRAFRTGLISVDNLKLDSQAQQMQREQELAEAAAAAATAEDNQSTSSASGKAKKYFCNVEGCGKQAQKQHMCKRHHRLQEDFPATKLQSEAPMSGPLSNYVHGMPQTVFAQPIASCQFPNCSQVACGGTLLCLAHSKATFCWQPGCENLVSQQQYCDFHAFRQQCAYEGCMYSAERNYSGCTNHVMASKCRHDFCDKYVAGMDSEWCRLHQISCQDTPCALCKLHGLSMGGFGPSPNENNNQSRYNANATGWR